MVTGEGNPEVSVSQQAEQALLPYQRIIEQEHKAYQEKNGESVVEGSLTLVGPMSILAPKELWTPGGISTRVDGKELDTKQYEEYSQLLLKSIVATAPGGQRGCMDGRPVGFALLLGPKTAGGSQCDPFRIIMASYGYDPSNPLSYDEAAEIVDRVEKRLGFKPGGHKLDQCGAYKFATDCLDIFNDNPDEISAGVKAFLTAVGSAYDESRQGKIKNAALLMAAHKAEIFPQASQVAGKVESKNASACVELGSAHKELSIVVFGGVDATVDNDRLIHLTTHSPIIQGERQAFGYNWGMHLEIAKDLGGELGALYLQAVPSQDIPILTKLTDGTPHILAFQPA